MRTNHSPPPVVSRTSICILSFVLVYLGMCPSRLSPPLAVDCILAGTAGFIAYFGLKWRAFLQSRALVAGILIDCGHSPL